MEATTTAPPHHGKSQRSATVEPTITERARALDLYWWLTKLLPPEWFEPTAEPVGWRCRLCDYSEAQINPTPPAGSDPFDVAWEAGCDAIQHQILTHPDLDDHDRHSEEHRRQSRYTGLD